MLFLSKLKVRDKVVLVRIDLNSSIIKNKIQCNDRFVAHSRTIKYLINKKAKVVILAHQGRKGKEDFRDLKQHSKILSKLVGKKIKYIDDLLGRKAIESIKKLKSGHAILLKNVREYEEETKELTLEQHARSELVTTISPLLDVFVLDAFSIAHRAHASVIGFTKNVKSCAGLVLENDIKNLEELKKKIKNNKPLYMLAGAKPEEDLMLLKEATKNRATVLMGGTFVLLYLSSKGKRLGKSDELSEKHKEVAEELKTIEIENTFLPDDFAIEENEKREEIRLRDLPSDKPLLDIGKITIGTYKEIISKAKIIIVKGPLGKYEDPRFALSTKEIYETIAASRAFSVLGGGNTLDAINQLRIPKEKFSYVSLAGGALLEYLAGKKLPGIAALEKTKK